MIEGYRTIFDMGPVAGTTAPQDPAQARRADARADTRDSAAVTDTSGVATRAALFEKGNPGFREPTLPRLSAEALATALMTAEPDKALVPRVLPAEMAAEPG